MNDESKPTDALIALARDHVEFLCRCARADASDAGANTTLQEAAKWEAAIKKATGDE